MMRKLLPGTAALALLLSGCTVGSKSTSISVIYLVTAILSAVLLVGYCAAVKKKSPWYLLLFTCVLVVNCGYWALSVANDLAAALMANRLAYLGSVFLPFSMLMIILHVTGLRPRRWLSWVLLGLGVLVFLVAASPGYLDIYYKEVAFRQENGVGMLVKVYGPLHSIYLVYLLGYFGAMVYVIVHATLRDKVESLGYAAILAISVFVNIGVWLIEQLVRIDFEILSISYIISESFLLGLHFMMAEAQKPTPAVQPAAPAEETDPELQAHIALFTQGLALLTPKEQEIYRCYLEGLSTADIMDKLQIKENTLKFHNKNLYSKLGVSSRKQLLHYAARLPRDGSAQGSIRADS